MQCCKYGQAQSSGVCTNCTDSTNCEKCIGISYCYKCKNTSTHYLNAAGACPSKISFCDVHNYVGNSCFQCGTDLSVGIVHKYWDSAATACVSSSCTTSNTLFYKQKGSKICMGCDSQCSQCTKPKTNYYCATNCAAKHKHKHKIQTPYTSSGKACKLCSDSTRCATYTANTCTCTSCPNITYSNTCYSTCPSGTYFQSNACNNCLGCNSCISGIFSGCGSNPTCFTSPTVYYKLVSQANNSIYGCCQAGNFNNGTACSSCASNCKFCTSNNVTHCTQGIDGTLGVSGGYYNNGAGAMVQCDSKFNTCFNAGNNQEFREICFYGAKLYYNDGGAAVVAECAGSGQVSNCELFWYDNGSSSWKCKKCNVTGDHSLKLTDYTCVTSCPTGTSKKKINYKFYGEEFYAFVCVTNFAHCNNSSYDEYLFYGCTACSTGYFQAKTEQLFPYYDNTYPDKEITLCHKCHPSCKTCTTFSPYACISCNTGKFFHNSVCLSTFPPVQRAIKIKIILPQTSAMQTLALQENSL